MLGTMDQTGIYKELQLVNDTPSTAEAREVTTLIGAGNVHIHENS